MHVRDKVIVVTGAASGIGRALARELLSRGGRVAAVDRNAEALASLRSDLDASTDQLATFTLDVSDRVEVAALPDKVVSHFDAVDGLINNAGVIQPFVRVHQLDDSTIERVFNVNFFGALHLTRGFLPLLMARPEAHIVNVSSMGAFLPVPGQTIYGASKAALKLFTEGLWAELTDTSVRVTLVLPGAVGTNIMENSGVSIPGRDPASTAHKVYPAESAAKDIVDGMEADAYRVLVGRDAKIMDAMVRLTPKRAAAFITKQMRSLLGEG